LKTKIQVKLRLKHFLILLLERFFPQVVKALNARSVEGQRSIAVIAYSLANVENPLAVLNHYTSSLEISSTTLWQAICLLQQQREPAFDSLMAGADSVVDIDLRLLLWIKLKLIKPVKAVESDILSLLRFYNESVKELENKKSVVAALVSLIFEKAPVERTESWLREIGLSVSSLSEHQQLQFLSSIIRAKDYQRFVSWEAELTPVFSEIARLKVQLMRYSIFGGGGAFSKLESSFSALQNPVCEAYKAKVKPLFDKIDTHNNFLDARFEPDSVRSVQQLILQKIIEAKPFSYMRLGDGESYGFSNNYYVDQAGLKRQELHWWGQVLDEECRLDLQSQFLAALESVDVLGIPTAIRLIKELKTSDKNGFIVNSLVSRLFCTMQGVGPFLSNRRILEDQSNLFIFDSRFLSELFRAAKKVYVVSGLKSDIVEGWVPDRNKVQHIEIPTHRLLQNTEIGSSFSIIFPEVYRDYMVRVASLAEPGTVFLFSAGFIGKILISEAARNGAVALDVGQFLVVASLHSAESK